MECSLKFVISIKNSGKKRISYQFCSEKRKIYNIKSVSGFSQTCHGDVYDFLNEKKIPLSLKLSIDKSSLVIT